MNTIGKLLGMLALGGLMLTTSAWPAAAQGQPPGGRGAPPEALVACAGKAEGDACLMISPRDNREARDSCIVTPDATLACLPEGAPPPAN